MASLSLTSRELSRLKNPWRFFSRGFFLPFFNVDKPVLLADIIKNVYSQNVSLVYRERFKVFRRLKMMERYQSKTLVGICFFAAIFLAGNPVWAQSGGHASVGLGHGEEGYLHLEEMVKHLEFRRVLFRSNRERFKVFRRLKMMERYQSKTLMGICFFAAIFLEIGRASCRERV